jgi:hypothetical protein
VTDTVYAVVVTHRRPEQLATSLGVLTTQSRLPDHLIVVDNDDDDAVRQLVEGQPVPTTYLDHAETWAGQAVSHSACCTHWLPVPTGSGWPTTTAGPLVPTCWPR